MKETDITDKQDNHYHKCRNGNDIINFMHDNPHFGFSHQQVFKYLYRWFSKHDDLSKDLRKIGNYLYSAMKNEMKSRGKELDREEFNSMICGVPLVSELKPNSVDVMELSDTQSGDDAYKDSIELLPSQKYFNCKITPVPSDYELEDDMWYEWGSFNLPEGDKYKNLDYIVEVSLSCGSLSYYIFKDAKGKIGEMFNTIPNATSYTIKAVRKHVGIESNSVDLMELDDTQSKLVYDIEFCPVYPPTIPLPSDYPLNSGFADDIWYALETFKCMCDHIPHDFIVEVTFDDGVWNYYILKGIVRNNIQEIIKEEFNNFSLYDIKAVRKHKG